MTQKAQKAQKAATAQTMSKESANLRLLAETRVQGVKNGLPFFSAKAWTSTEHSFSAYCECVENLQRALYKAESGAVSAETKTASFGIYFSKLAKIYGFSDAEKAAVLKHISKYSTLAAGERKDLATDETKKALAAFRKRKQEVEAKAVGESYTAETKLSDLDKIQAEKDAFMRDSYRVEKALYTQSSPAKFRHTLELVCGYILVGYDKDIARTWQTSAERADTSAWLRWIAKAQALGIEFEPYKVKKDLDGLKKAVKTAFEEKETRILELAKAQAAQDAAAVPTTDTPKAADTSAA